VGQANGFAQAALHAVTLHGAAEGTPHSESDAQTVWRWHSPFRPCLQIPIHFGSRPIEDGHGRREMAAPLLIDSLEIRMAQKTRRAGKSCCFLWRHGEVPPRSQRGISHHAFGRRQNADDIDRGSERH
jgi:hypothetical protein